MIKTTKYSKRAVLKFNGKKYIGFKIGDLPKKFTAKYIRKIRLNSETEQPEEYKIKGINKWFNLRGYTFIPSGLLTDCDVL